MRGPLLLCLAALGSAACVDRGEVLRPARATGGSGGSPAGGTGGSSSGAGGEPSMMPERVVSALAVGTSHAAAIASDTLYTWGANESGELGQGDTVERHVPTAVTTSVSFVSLTAAENYTCGLDEVGAVYCFGGNERGQLGQGDRNARSVPTRVPLPIAARLLSGSFQHACALLADASLYCWGRNFEGELGQSDSPPTGNQPDTADDALSPIAVPGTDWSYVSAGDGVTCGIRFDGTLWCWGRNTQHQLGPDPTPQIRHPVQIGSDNDWLRVVSGLQYELGLKQDHSIWGWGENVASSSNEGAPLGLDADLVDSPTRVGSASDWTTLATRAFHTCAVNRSAQLWCWGRNIEGQLGTGDLDLRKTPTHVADGIADVAVSWFSTCAQTTAGHVLCTGKNDHGEIGDGTTDRPEAFTDVTPAP
jgi:alpha-tubulin suppressor-like RCC1 family protein